MSEWWTYSLSDFLMFSPQTYYRLFELYNEAIWPAQIATLAAGIALLLVLLRRTGALTGSVAALALSACWFWTAWGYHHLHYATINWAAEYFAALFALQGGMLLLSAIIPGRLRVAPANLRGSIGLGLAAGAVLLYPLIAPALGRPWSQAEVFGLMPDPTALATIGILLAMERLRIGLLLLPLLWCAVSAATLWAMTGAGG